VGSITERHNSETGLRASRDDELALSGQRLTHEVGFAGKWLRPGETILIPVSLLLGEDERDEDAASWWPSDSIIRDWIDHLRGRPYNFGGELIPASVMARIASQSADPKLDSGLCLVPLAILRPSR
jgi:hypothetical protein